MAGWVRTIDLQLEKLTTIEEYRSALLGVRDYLEVHGPRGHARVGGEPVHCGVGGAAK
jgi:hypothetical protein